MQVYAEVPNENVCVHGALRGDPSPSGRAFPISATHGSPNTAEAQPRAAPHEGRAHQYPPGQDLAIPEALPPQTQALQQPPHRGIPLCVCPPWLPSPSQAPSGLCGLVPAAPGLFSKGKHEVKR